MQRNLLVLDDYEGQMANAPAMAKIRELVNVTILNRPLNTKDKAMLSTYHIILALRERTQLDEAFFSHCPKLQLVLQTGGHAYHLDQTAVNKRSILVALGRGATKPMVVVPELTFGLILGLIRQIYPLNNQMAQGEWPQTMGGSLYGRTLGILGYGRHGRPIANIGRAFGMKIIAWGREGEQYNDDEPDVQRLPLDDLLAQSDIVSVHLRLADDTRGLLGREQFAKMKPSALFINTARGAIVDEAALVEALRNGRIAGAGLDVFTQEPLPPSSPIRTLPTVLLTPHVGWQVSDVIHEFVAIAAEQLEAWLNGRLPASQLLNPHLLNG